MSRYEARRRGSVAFGFRVRSVLADSQRKRFRYLERGLIEESQRVSERVKVKIFEHFCMNFAGPCYLSTVFCASKLCFSFVVLKKYPQ